MRAVIQRVKESSVRINNEVERHIDQGILILLGIEDSDSNEDVIWLASKILGLRIFSDDDGKMNLSVRDIEGEILVISQFTLFGSTKKGNRPSFIKAAKPEIAIPIYEEFLNELKFNSELKVERGEFGADMEVKLINDGPVTILIDTKNRE